MDFGRLRSWRSQKQGLDSPLGMGAAATLARAGWSRNVGGSSTYLGLSARSGLDPGAVNGAIGRMEICELPAARGCTYVVPAEDFGLALAMSRIQNPPEKLTSPERRVGMTEGEMERLMSAVLDGMGGETLDPAQIRDRCGDAVRSFGEEGRKVGMTTSLPSALGRLQTLGEIVRVPAAGRLDSERYMYRRWTDGPGLVPAEDAPRLLVEKYARWAGPFSMEEFRWFSGFGARAAAGAVASAGLAEYEPGWFGHADEADGFWGHGAGGVQVRFIGCLDNLFLLTRSLRTHVAEEDRGVPAYSENASENAGGLSDLASNAVVLGGRLVGFWDFDPEADELLFNHWAGEAEAVGAECARVGQMVREHLGDVRTFSLDSPKSRKDRLAFLRN